MPPLTSQSDDSDNDSSLGEIPAKAPSPVTDKVNGKGKRKNSAEEDSAEDDVEGTNDEDEGEDRFEVESILDWRWKKGRVPKLELKVKWFGYEKEVDQTWEPEENLQADAPRLLGEYFTAIGGRPAGPTSASNQKASMKAAKVQEDRPSKRQKRGEELEENYVPKGSKWDKEIKEITSLERLPNGKLLVFLNFKNGRSSKVESDVAYERFPQQMLKYYESKLRKAVDAPFRDYKKLVSDAGGNREFKPMDDEST